MNNKLYVYLNEQFMETNITSDDVIEKDKEIKRLQNIIDEYTKWLEAHLDDEFYWFKMYDKLQELKENK